MESLLTDVRYAVRALLRSPGWTSMAVLTLALGTGANTAVFNLVDALLFRPAPGVRAPGQVVTIFTSDFSSGPYGATSYPDFQSIASGVTAFEATAAEDASTLAPARIGEALERVRVSKVSGKYFGLVGLAVNPGRGLSPSDDTSAVAVVSHEFWTRVFGADPAAIGSTITVNDRPLTVVGVGPVGFRGLSLGQAVDVWTPLTPVPASAAERTNRGLSVIARLKRGATIDEAQQQLSALATELAHDFPATNLGTLDRPNDPRRMTVTPAMRIGPQFRRDVVSLAAVLMGGVGLVLVLACANIASLLLSRATTRARELAVRRALGAGSARLVRQLLTETAVLAGTASAAGLIIAAWTTDLLPSFFPAQQAELVRDSPMGWHVFAFAIAMGSVSSLMLGVLPALRSVRPPLVAALRSHGGEISGRAGSGLRSVLVGAQVAIACVLLVGAALLVQSVAHMLADDLGLATKDAIVASVEVPATWTRESGLAFYDEALVRARAIPGVISAGWVRNLPFERTARRGFRAEGYAARSGEDRELNVNIAAPGTFETLGIPLRSGRTFTAADAAGPRVVVVNETFARRFFGGHATGRRVTDSSNTVFEIVGVVGDTKYLTVTEAPPPFVYYPLSQNYAPRMTLIARTAMAPENLAEEIRRAVRTLNPEVGVFAMRTLRAHREQALGGKRLTASLVSVSGLLAVVIAIVGLYGAIAYLVTQRQREIGVRMALGATPDGVIALIVGHGVRIAGAGLAIGLVAAALAARFAPLALYGITPLDGRTYIVVTALLMATAAFAAYIPARHAAGIDPARALGQD